MNYIKQINFFWEKSKRHSLGAGDIAMYMYLLHTSNGHGWENPVMEPNATLQYAIGVQSYNTIKEIRNRLQQHGLLRFKTKNGSAQVEYDLFDVEKQTFSNFEEVAAKVSEKVTEKVGAKVSEKVGKNTNVLYKHKPKPKQKEVVFPRPDKNFDVQYFTGIGYEFPCSPALLTALDGFLKYRKNHVVHGPVVSGEQVEMILGGFIAREMTDEQAIACLTKTIEKGAKNVIYEIDKPKTDDRQTNNSQPWRL